MGPFCLGCSESCGKDDSKPGLGMTLQWNESVDYANQRVGHSCEMGRFCIHSSTVYKLGAGGPSWD